MPPLRELQAAMRRAILTGDAGHAADLVAVDGIPAVARLDVYRHHFLTTLSDALAANFPVVRRLVGAAFFRAAARRFAQQQPPAGPCLFAYGGGFDAWLRALPETAAMPWIADVAALEWVLLEAAHAADAVALSADSLAAVPPERLVKASLLVHPSVRLLASEYPVHRIWSAHQSDDATGSVDLDQGGVHLLVYRRGTDVGWQILPGAEFAVIRALVCGAPIEGAMAAGGGSVDVAALFTVLLGDGLVVALRRNQSEELSKETAS